MKYYILHALILRYYRGTFKRWRFNKFTKRAHFLPRYTIKMDENRLVLDPRYPKIRHDSNLAKTAQRRFHMSRKCGVHVTPVTFDVYLFVTISRLLNIKRTYRKLVHKRMYTIVKCFLYYYYFNYWGINRGYYVILRFESWHFG